MKINLYGGPGIGKSTVAGLVFSELKIRGYNAEIVHEYAKELVYEGTDLRKVDSFFQDRIFIEQLRRELLFFSKVDILITDSPLMLNAYYNGGKKALSLVEMTQTDADLNFYLTRTNEHFEGKGRSHNEKESLAIDKKMLDFLKQQNIDLINVDGDSRAKALRIVEIIEEKKNA